MPNTATKRAYVALNALSLARDDKACHYSNPSLVRGLYEGRDLSIRPRRQYPERYSRTRSSSVSDHGYQGTSQVDRSSLSQCVSDCLQHPMASSYGTNSFSTSCTKCRKSFIGLGTHCPTCAIYQAAAAIMSGRYGVRTKRLNRD